MVSREQPLSWVECWVPEEWARSIWPSSGSMTRVNAQSSSLRSKSCSRERRSRPGGCFITKEHCCPACSMTISSAVSSVVVVRFRGSGQSTIWRSPLLVGRVLVHYCSTIRVHCHLKQYWALLRRLLQRSTIFINAVLCTVI